MILAFSTSSPWASAALISPEGVIVRQEKRLAPMQASGACLDIIQSWPKEGLAIIAADLGPGSFTGVRVGVTLAKSLAFAWNLPCSGVPSFDLISPTSAVAIPSRKGEYFVRVPGQEPYRTAERPETALLGFGPWFANEETFPEAAGFAKLLQRLEPVRPEDFLPTYLIEPSISIPKKPYAGGPVCPQT